MKVELIVFLYDKKLADLDIQGDDIKVKMAIDTDNIEAIRQRIHDDSEEICAETCIIYMKSGENFQIGKPYKEMLKIWES